MSTWVVGGGGHIAVVQVGWSSTLGVVGGVVIVNIGGGGVVNVDGG